MNQEILSIVKKSAKIAGVTCLTAGVVAIATSGAALKAIAESGKYLAKSVKDILEEKPEQEENVEAKEVTAAEEPAPTVEVTTEETV